MDKNKGKMSETDFSKGNSKGDKGELPDDAAPFERWLDKKLKTAYGSVLEEPIPEDLINLLRKKLDSN